ncbi:MerR family transcriptional regulator [Lihuaxuella thermophila]|uniref:MerR family regulatory protein n=1 Tax=Lihuaxuella thermophila TaxID=1173111 RepID=A0A1H8BS72_9BACL|nr:MerR family transcriptional regulator [Lihuaxuella thermophila]SEM85622.1 MerR family regulatory protein [Lihuaxuella thermophila]
MGELAKQTGLTVRTLHHYDRIGLLSPSRYSDSGHRLYTKADLSSLQQIISSRRCHTFNWLLRGLFGGFIEQFGGMTQVKVMVNIGIVTSLIFPIDSLFRKMTIYLFDSADKPFL